MSGLCGTGSLHFRVDGAVVRLEELERQLSRKRSELHRVIDEVQDLQPEWVQALLSRLTSDGRAVLMEDGERLLTTPNPESSADAALLGTLGLKTSRRADV